MNNIIDDCSNEQQSYNEKRGASGKPSYAAGGASHVIYKETDLSEEETEIDLVELFFRILADWKAIVLCILIGAGLAFMCHHFFVQPMYKATSELFIMDTNTSLSMTDLQLSSALTEDYASVLKSRSVLGKVIEDLKLVMTPEELNHIVSISNPKGTHIIDIDVKNTDPILAVDICSKVLDYSIEKICEIGSQNTPTVIDRASMDSVKTVTPSLFKFLLIGAGAGFLIMCGIIFLTVMFDTTIKNEDDVMKYLALPVLSNVPYVKPQKGKAGRNSGSQGEYGKS